MQTIAVPLALADAPSTLVLRGGSHVPWAPTVDDLVYGYVPALRRMGFRVDLELRRWGWFPLGGGELVCIIARARIHSSTRSGPGP